MIYLHVAEADMIYLMDIYGKDRAGGPDRGSEDESSRGSPKKPSATAIRAARAFDRGRHDVAVRAASRCSNGSKTGLEEAIRHAHGRDHAQDHDRRVPRPAAGDPARGA